MLRTRRDRRVPNRWDAVFTSATGMLRDPSNTQRELRHTLNRAGYPDIT